MSFQVFRLNRIRLWSDSVVSSLILQFRILWTNSIDAAVKSIQFSQVGPEKVRQSFSFMVSSPCGDRNSANILPLVSVFGLCYNLCLLFASMPQTRFLDFILSMKFCVVVRSHSGEW